MGVSPELQSAFAAAADELLERLQQIVDQAVEQTRARLQAEHDAARRQVEAELEARAGAMEKEGQVMAAARADEVLDLSLAGERDVSVLRSTLCAVDGSMLAATFSGRWDTQAPKDSRGRFFIDYPPQVFDPLLGYLRETKLAGPGTPVVWPPPVAEEHQGLFRKMAEYYGVAPPPVFSRTPSRFAGTNNSVDIDGSPEAIRLSADVPVTLRGLQVLGPRTEEVAQYVGWLAVHRGDEQLVRQDVDYTVEAAEGVAAELMLDSPVELEAGVAVLCVRGPPSTCGESSGHQSEVVADGVVVTYANSPLDEAGTGLLEGVIPGVVLSRQL
ncbi:unnamed protein product [Prorocentrum cordatum]|uniref:Potassium channel tetramerisation-type BTB domain-containing protein n=1 Tax=Prorocentrum cordatum TaxID=2364126 RepID=A0ABN9U784_9DINO|nr:unnamed protein product [Polarella glacialis]